MARAEAYDAHLDEERRKEQQLAIRLHLDRAAALGRRMQQLGFEGLRQLEGKRDTRPPTELVRYIVAGIAEERRALGLPSDAVILEHHGPTDPHAFKTSETIRRAREVLG